MQEVYYTKVVGAGDSLVRAAMSQMNLSARAYHRVLKLARTIADLAGNDQIQVAHVADFFAPPVLGGGAAI
jgi:magnesium chelatase family protein